ncbi:MAG TPA: response regulator transcription factor [Nitrospira sp.]|nr:response regulator transcription factor [Nitrospira sp.]
MTKATPVQVLLVEDHTIVRQGVRSLLETYPNLDIVGEAHDGEEAVMKVGKLQPAVVVMDINMPKMDGVAATRLIRTNYPHIAVLGLSVNAEGYHHEAMLRAGAFEVVSKEHAVDRLYSAIQRAVASVKPILILEEPVETQPSAETPVNESATKERNT